MHKILFTIFHWFWITLHAALYLIGAGVALRFFDLFGMSLWLVLGWVVFIPTLMLPDMLGLLWRRIQQRRGAHQDTMQQPGEYITAQEEQIST